MMVPVTASFSRLFFSACSFTDELFGVLLIIWMLLFSPWVNSLSDDRFVHFSFGAPTHSLSIITSSSSHFTITLGILKNSNCSLTSLSTWFFISSKQNNTLLKFKTSSRILFFTMGGTKTWSLSIACSNHFPFSSFLLI